MKHSQILQGVEQFFSNKVNRFGATPEGLDYNSRQAQEVRFEQFLRLFDHSTAFSLIDYGCGYGALAHFLRERGFSFQYHGFDISEAMIAHARKVAPEGQGWNFYSDPAHLLPADYTVACGIFNLKLETDVDVWKEYILDTLNSLAGLSKLGFGFNILTSYSDKDRMRPDLYYGDPLFFFDHCKSRFSRNVALLHDYGLYDWTILVRLT